MRSYMLPELFPWRSWPNILRFTFHGVRINAPLIDEAMEARFLHRFVERQVPDSARHQTIEPLAVFSCSQTLNPHRWAQNPSRMSRKAHLLHW
jgi:hypothetical protein